MSGSKEAALRLLAIVCGGVRGGGMESVDGRTGVWTDGWLISHDILAKEMMIGRYFPPESIFLNTACGDN